MKGINLTKKVVAVALAASMVFSQPFSNASNSNTVLAADGSFVATSYIVNGDFETGDTTGWTVTPSSTDTSEVTAAVTSNTWASNPSNNYFNFWSNSAGGNATLPKQSHYLLANII